MADSKPVTGTVRVGSVSVPYNVWRGLDGGGVIAPLAASGQSAIAGCVQFKGNLGAGVTLQASNDGETYFDMYDVRGNLITATTDALFEFSTAAALIRPALNGPVGASAEVVLVLRG